MELVSVGARARLATEQEPHESVGKHGPVPWGSARPRGCCAHFRVVRSISCALRSRSLCLTHSFNGHFIFNFLDSLQTPFAVVVVRNSKVNKKTSVFKSVDLDSVNDSVPNWSNPAAATNQRSPAWPQPSYWLKSNMMERT